MPIYEAIVQADLFITRTFFPRKSGSLGWEVRRRKVQAVKRWPCALLSYMWPVLVHTTSLLRLLWSSCYIVHL